MASGFFKDGADDDDLEVRNIPFWTAMIDHIRRDGFPEPPRRVLDIGSHRGGLLARIAELWGPAELIGIEPIEAARSRARLRLGALAPSVVMLEPGQWGSISSGSVELAVCHEVLFLLPDLDGFVGQLARVLSARGRAYIATGCHTENPLWPQWKAELGAMGQSVFDHAPMSLLSTASRHGLFPSVRPLRDAGWASYAPTDGPFSFPSVGALIDHQFRHKLLFRLARV